MATTYAELKNEIASYMGRSDLATGTPVPVDTFIDNAEAMLSRLLRVGDNECRTTLSLTANDERLALPDDWGGGARKVTYITSGGDRTECEFFHIQRLEDRQEQFTSSTGRRFYTLYDNAIWLNPVASETGDLLELIYYFQLAHLSGSNADNWLLLEDPDLYLNASLFYGYMWQQNPQMAAFHKGLVDESIAEKRKQDAHERWGYHLTIEAG